MVMRAHVAAQAAAPTVLRATNQKAKLFARAANQVCCWVRNAPHHAPQATIPLPLMSAKSAPAFV